MKALKEARRKRELAKGDIRVLRNQQASIMFKVNNYGKLVIMQGQYYDLDALDTTPEADKVSMALIYLTTVFLLMAIVLFLLKGKEYGVGMLS